jgi:uncharacterized membrane protein YjgN (DUF898 family)
MILVDLPSHASRRAMDDVTAIPVEPAIPALSAAPVTFTGQRSEFLRLLIRGALLEACTVGFYRFWLNTDMRRHLWSNTAVGGDVLEYTGTAKELLIGFLFALAILVPIYLVYFFIGLEAERLQAFASIPLVIFFYLFAQFAVYRARRYRLTRTVWRGVRFWMSGSGWAFAGRAGLWSLVVLLTLGLLLPWYQAALERYKMRHTAYGDLAGHFNGTGGGLFKRAGWIWLLTWAVIVTIVVLPPPMPLGEALVRALPNSGGVWAVLAVLLGIALVIAWPFFHALYKSAEWRWWISGIRFGEVRFESRLRPGALIGLYWKVIGWSGVLLIGLSMAWGIVLGSALTAAGGKADQMKADDIMALMEDPLMLVGLALGYIAAALGFGIVVRMYLRRDVWARVATTLVAHNLATAYNITAQGVAAGALGEGFADSLDVGGF